MKRTLLLVHLALAIVIGTNLNCKKPAKPEPENMNKHWFGRVIDRSDNTIVPYCTVSLYEVRFDGANNRFSKIAEQTCGTDGKFDFRFVRKSDVVTYSFNIDKSPYGYSYSPVFTGLNLFPDQEVKKSEINMDLFTVSYGELKVRFIGDGTGNEVVLGYGGGTDYIFRHGCDTIAWWSNESGKPANFRYWVYGMNDTTSHLINDIMIKFGTVYKEVHF